MNGPKSRNRKSFLTNSLEVKTCWLPLLESCGWPFSVLLSESEKPLLLVGSINVLQEENKQLSTEMLIFIEKVEWPSQPPRVKKEKKNDTLEGNDITCKRCFQEVSEVANKLGMSAYNFFLSQW